MKRKATKLLSAAMSAVVLLSNGAVYASEEQQNKEKTVSSWEWTENEYLSETENGWELQISDLDGAEKLTRETLKELLPTSVMAEIREEAEEKQEADPAQEEEPEAAVLPVRSLILQMQNMMSRQTAGAAFQGSI